MGGGGGGDLLILRLHSFNNSDGRLCFRQDQIYLFFFYFRLSIPALPRPNHFTVKTEAQFIVPALGYKVDYGIGLSFKHGRSFSLNRSNAV